MGAWRLLGPWPGPWVGVGLRVGLGVALGLGMSLGTAIAEPRDARLRPPAELACPRDALTLYGGEVQRYQRKDGQTRLVLATDWGTTETVTLSHPGTRDPSAWFLMRGQPFQAGDWPLIETARGRLRPGVRAAAWVCDDGRNATVDWQPPREP